MRRQYITTAIDYPNAPPHMGHVLEKVLADVCARWFRLRGDEVRFQIGTDEHGIKIQDTAKKEGISPRELVDRNVPLFRELYERLQISSDVFIRTSDRETHWPTVIELWKKLQSAGALEKRTYTGLYCSGCERFITQKELVSGMCPIHQKVPEQVKEENWFFLLQREGAWLKELLTETYTITPESRAQETLSLIDQGLEDVSFSRPRSSLAWGIPVPGDESQTMYVWCDALTNYISGLDYFGKSGTEMARHAKPSEETAPLRSSSFAGHTSLLGEVWWDDATVTHVIGKDIARFHALIWPTMLRHAGVRAPDRLLIHGFLTSEGQKMSKSLGNVVAPDDVLQHFDGNPDPLRFYLSHEIPVGNDGDFSWKRIDELYNAKLRNQLGNLLNRVLVLLQKKKGILCMAENEIELNSRYAKECWRIYDEEAMRNFHLHLALDSVDGWLSYGNGYMDSTKPWAKNDEENLKNLWHVAEVLRHVSLMLLPFMPGTAQEISRQLHVPYAERMLERAFVITDAMKVWGSQKDWKTVGEPRILFPPRSE